MRTMSHCTWLVVHAALDSAVASRWFDDAGLAERAHNALRWASGYVGSLYSDVAAEDLINVLSYAEDRALRRCTDTDVSVEGIDALVHLAVQLRAALKRVLEETSEATSP